MFFLNFFSFPCQNTLLQKSIVDFGLYGPRDCYQADFLKEIREFVRIAGIHDLEKYLKLYVLAQMETNWQWLVKVE